MDRRVLSHLCYRPSYLIINLTCNNSVRFSIDTMWIGAWIILWISAVTTRVLELLITKLLNLCWLLMFPPTYPVNYIVHSLFLLMTLLKILELIHCLAYCVLCRTNSKRGTIRLPRLWSACITTRRIACYSFCIALRYRLFVLKIILDVTVHYMLNKWTIWRKKEWWNMKGFCMKSFTVFFIYCAVLLLH